MDARKRGSTSGCPFPGRNNAATQVMNSSSSSSRLNMKRKTSPGNKSDVGWEHCSDVNGNLRRVRCKYCEKIMGGVSRLKHHLACSHKDASPCLEVPDDVKNKMIEYISKTRDMSTKKKHEFFGSDTNDVEMEAPFVRGSNKNVQLKSMGKSEITIHQIFKKDLREEVCQQISKFFYTSAIPFNCIKNPEFVKMCQLIGKYGIGLKPPSYNEISEKYLNEEVACIKKLHEEHREQWKKIGCSIILNGWTEKKGRFICSFFVNSPKGTIFLSSIDTSKFSAIKVFKKLDNIIEEIGEKNVVQVIADNVANYKVVGEMLMKKKKTIFWIPCAAYCIDSILEDFAKKMKIHCWTIVKVKKITTYIYARIKVVEMLKHFTKGKDLIRFVGTRFATFYLTLECFNNNKDALINMFDSNTWNSSEFAPTKDGQFVQLLVKNDKFWKNVQTCLKAAFPLIKFLQLVDSCEKPIMGFIYEEMNRAKEKIRTNLENAKQSYELIWKIIDKRWKLQLHQPLYAAAYYLNPQFHYSPNFKANFEITNGLYKCLEKMIPDIDVMAKIHVQLDEFKARNGSFGSEVALMTKEEKSPAMWWDSYGAEFPELQKFAIQILSLTCNSSRCERNWSTFERVHLKQRNYFHQKRMNDLIFVMYNLKLKDKQIKKSIEMDSFEDVPSDNEWMINERENCNEDAHEESDDEEEDFVSKDKDVGREDLDLNEVQLDEEEKEEEEEEEDTHEMSDDDDDEGADFVIKDEGVDWEDLGLNEVQFDEDENEEEDRDGDTHERRDDHERGGDFVIKDTLFDWGDPALASLDLSWDGIF